MRLPKSHDHRFRIAVLECLQLLKEANCGKGPHNGVSVRTNHVYQRKGNQNLHKQLRVKYVNDIGMILQL